MNTFDLSPLFRSGVGFDRLARLAESALRQTDEQGTSYPPYNIEKSGDDAYIITLAVAGFTESDLTIEVENDDLLTISGAQAAKSGGEERTFLHRGVAERDFTRRFQLADHMKVADAKLSHGLLTISVVREVPEEAKPRRIEISTSSAALPQKAA